MSIICPRCGVTNCYRHCNSCGNDIIWYNPVNGLPLPHQVTGRNQPFNPRGGLHHGCMTGKGNWFDKTMKGEKIIDWT